LKANNSYNTHPRDQISDESPYLHLLLLLLFFLKKGKENNKKIKKGKEKKIRPHILTNFRREIIGSTNTSFSHIS